MSQENILKSFFPGSNIKYSNSRILFAKFNMSGLNDFHEYSTNSDMFKYFEFGPHEHLNESIEYINNIQDRIFNGFHGGHAMYWFLRLRETKKVIGSMALIRVDFDRGIGEIGKALSPTYWGHGYMSEAMDMYLDYCKNTLHLKEIISFTRDDNIPNIRLMEKSGFYIVKRLKSHYKDTDGTTHDAVVMSKLL